MSGPWEDYQQTETQDTAAPWLDYQQPSTTTTPPAQPYQRQPASWGEVIGGLPFRTVAAAADIIPNFASNVVNLGKAAYGTGAILAGRPDLAPDVSLGWTPVTTAFEKANVPGFLANKETTPAQRIVNVGGISALQAPILGPTNLLRNIALGGVSGTAGQATTEATGSPLAGIAASVLTGRPSKGKVSGASTLQELDNMSTDLRNRMYATGQTFDPTALKQSVKSGVESTSPEFPVGGGGTLAPNTQEALNQIDRLVATGAQVRIDQLEHINTLLNKAILAGGRDKTYALAAKKKLDEFVSTVGGETGNLWKQARAAETKAFMSKDVKDVVESAEKSSKPTSLQIRSQFNDLLNSPQINRYTPEQQTLIKQIADGTVTEKALEKIGKLAPKDFNLTSLFLLLNPKTLTKVGLGSTAAATANALAKSRVNMLDELIRGGQMPQTMSLPQRLGPTAIPVTNILANQLQGQQ